MELKIELDAKQHNAKNLKRQRKSANMAEEAFKILTQSDMAHGCMALSMLILALDNFDQFRQIHREAMEAITACEKLEGIKFNVEGAEHDTNTN